MIDNTNRILENETIWKNLILPFPQMSARTRQKIGQFCDRTGLNELLTTKADRNSSSTLKLVEIIRAVIQLPYIILIDDFDLYFDEHKRKQVCEILDHAASNGTCIIVTSKQKLTDFELNFHIHDNKLVKL